MRLQALTPHGIRLVRLPCEELRHAHKAQAALVRHPRVRFIVAVDVFADTRSWEGQACLLQTECTGTLLV